MKSVVTYRVVRSVRRFDGKSYEIIVDGLSLKEAQKFLLDLFNANYRTNYSNFGLVHKNHLGRFYRRIDGCHGFKEVGRNSFLFVDC